MAPTPLNHLSLLADANDTWQVAENFMDWFTKITETLYTWSDALIKSRQQRVDEEYKLKKAEREAQSFAREMQRRVWEMQRRNKDAQQANAEANGEGNAQTETKETAAVEMEQGETYDGDTKAVEAKFEKRSGREVTFSSANDDKVDDMSDFLDFLNSQYTA